MKNRKKLHIEIVKQMLMLSTAGFGLVAALAWNSVIQEFVSTYIKPYMPENYGIISLLIYAVIITTVAVIVTLQLTNLLNRLESNNN